MSAVSWGNRVGGLQCRGVMATLLILLPWSIQRGVCACAINCAGASWRRDTILHSVMQMGILRDGICPGRPEMANSSRLRSHHAGLETNTLEVIEDGGGGCFVSLEGVHVTIDVF